MKLLWHDLQHDTCWILSSAIKRNICTPQVLLNGSPQNLHHAVDGVNKKKTAVTIDGSLADLSSSANHVSIKRTRYRVGGGAPLIPMKAAQWHMKPTKFDLSACCWGSIANSPETFTYPEANSLFIALLTWLKIKWFHQAALLDFPNLIRQKWSKTR